MTANRVLVSPDELRSFLVKLANLDFEFLASKTESVGLDSIYLMIGEPQRILSIGHRSGSEVTEAELDKLCSKITPEEKSHITRFRDQYQRLIPVDPRSGFLKRDPLFWILELKGKLCHVWSHSSYRSKHYGAFWLIEQLVPPHFRAFSEKKDFLYIPEEIPFERAILQLVQDWDLAKVCQNLDCRKPYFFATRTSQKYCSIRCAKPAIRAAKRKWWKRERGGAEK